MIVFGLFRGCSLAVQLILVLDARSGGAARSSAATLRRRLGRGGPGDLRACLAGARAACMRATNLILTGQVEEFAVP